MPPKGAVKPPHKLGTVVERNYGTFCLQLAPMPDLGVFQTTRGPTRATTAEANKDLAKAWTYAPREDILECVRKLSKTNALARGVAQPAGSVEHHAGSAASSGVSIVGKTGNSSSGVAQSAAAEQFPSHAGCVGTRERSADLNSGENRKTLLLQLKRPHYDAIKERRELWEARPLFDRSFRQTIYDKLAVVGNAAILQSGANTNDRVCIKEVRRYVPRGISYPLEDMVVELGADLLPDVANTRGRTEIYESLYGFQRCARGFVAMRLEWPNEARL